MMKILPLLILLSLQTVFAALPNYIGKVTAIRGDVNITRGIALYQAHKGLELEEKDSFFTSSRGSMQITFKDNTVITLGKSTVFKVDEYLYDEKKREDSKVTYKFRKGFFKSITGRIGKISAKNFKIQTKNSTIGVRGTEITGSSDAKKETIVCTKGVITVATKEKLVEAKENEKVSIKLDPKIDYIIATAQDMLLQAQVKQGMKSEEELKTVKYVKEEVVVVYKPEVKKELIKKGVFKKDAPIIPDVKMEAPKKVQKKELNLLDLNFLVQGDDFKTQEELRQDIFDFADRLKHNQAMEEKRRALENAKKYYKPTYPKKIPKEEPKREKDDLIEDIDQMDNILDDKRG